MAASAGVRFLLLALVLVLSRNVSSQGVANQFSAFNGVLDTEPLVSEPSCLGLFKVLIKGWCGMRLGVVLCSR